MGSRRSIGKSRISSPGADVQTGMKPFLVVALSKSSDFWGKNPQKPCSERMTRLELATLTLARRWNWTAHSLHSAEQPRPRLFVRPLRRVAPSPVTYV
jgi:hypothetical protein